MNHSGIMKYINISCVTSFMTKPSTSRRFPCIRVYKLDTI
ncbi:hypothetical protein ALT785_250081 [Alteromonas infernus]